MLAIEPRKLLRGVWVDWDAPRGMLAQRSCASRFVRRLFFVSSMSSVYTRSRRGLPIVLGRVAVLLFAVVALGISGEILRRAILLAVVAVVALDGERRPAKRPLSDVFRILAEHRVVSSRPSRRALRFDGRGSFGQSFGGAQLAFCGCNLRRLGGASRSRVGMFLPRRCRRRYHPLARR